jgi:hypothetical protein
MRALAVIAALLVALALTAAVAWYAAEAHYRGCVEAAKTTPFRGDPIDREVALRLGTDKHAKQVYRRVQGCSRLP